MSHPHHSVQVVVGAAIVRDGRLLAQQRAWPPAVAGRWELPGGRVEDGEAETFTLVRECAEELGVQIVPGQRVGDDVPVAGDRFVLRVYAAALADPQVQPRAVEHAAVRWLAAAELYTVEWLAADRVLLPQLKALLGCGRVTP